MNKKEKILYLAFLVAILLTVLCLELVTSKIGPIVPDTTDFPQLAYIMSYLCVGCTLLSTYFGIRYTKLPFILRTVMIGASANLVLLVYYMFFETSHLFCLGILGIAYLMLLRPNRE